MFDWLFGNRELKEAERIHALVEQAKQASTLRETIPHLKRFLSIVRSSTYAENYDPDFPAELVRNRIEQLLDINRLRMSLDRVFAPEEHYRPLEEMLAEIGVRKEYVYTSAYQKGEMAIDALFQNMVADITASRLQGAYQKEHLQKAAGALELKKRMREDFGLQQPAVNDTYVMACIRYGEGMLDARIAGAGNKEVNFLDRYLDVRKIAEQVQSHLQLTKAAEQEYQSTRCRRDERAAIQQLKIFAASIPDAAPQFFSNDGMGFYDHMLNTVSALMGEQGTSAEYHQLLGNVQHSWAQKMDEIKPHIEKEQDILYERARQAAEEGSVGYEGARNQFIQYSLTFSRLLNEDEGGIDAAVQPLEKTYRIAYHRNAREFVPKN
ncbi:hypothetical protein HY491_04175 [Candidatus Woesearchaeota archaeon]|nr:hypothetical protein [Candidatus Woesearchaeota archaeon]